MSQRIIITCLATLALAACGGGTTGNDASTSGNDANTGGGTDSGTDAGGTADDAGTDAASGTDTGTAAPDCATYCAAVAASCNGANRQYGLTDATQVASCMDACAGFGWATGAATDPAGDTLGCRTYHALAAAGSDTMHALHCPHAGPLGGAMCGTSLCADFCAADLTVCAGVYANMDACVTACGGLSDATTVTSPTTASGNTLSCRTYHLTAASATGGATLHCAHTGATSTTCM